MGIAVGVCWVLNGVAVGARVGVDAVNKSVGDGVICSPSMVGEFVGLTVGGTVGLTVGLLFATGIIVGLSAETVDVRFLISSILSNCTLFVNTTANAVEFPRLLRRS